MIRLSARIVTICRRSVRMTLPCMRDARSRNAHLRYTRRRRLGGWGWLGIGAIDHASDETFRGAKIDGEFPEIAVRSTFEGCGSAVAAQHDALMLAKAQIDDLLVGQLHSHRATV